MSNRSTVYDNARMDSLMVIVCVRHSCHTKRNYIVVLKCIFLNVSLENHKYKYLLLSLHVKSFYLYFYECQTTLYIVWHTNILKKWIL